jgi:hypothetical protein
MLWNRNIIYRPGAKTCILFALKASGELACGRYGGRRLSAVGSRTQLLGTLFRLSNDVLPHSENDKNSDADGVADDARFADLLLLLHGGHLSRHDYSSD